MEKDILLALFKEGRMTYADIVRLGFRRTDARILLDYFKKHELIREEGRKNWKRGKKLWYSLTAKGKRSLFSSKSEGALEAFKTLKEVVKAVPEVDALVILGELESQVRAGIRFVEDVYELLPRGAELKESTEKPEERERCKAILKETGGKVQVSIPEKRRLR
jgi:predicted ArsR family transcriptional regulator